jgi:hypothetical protein
MIKGLMGTRGVVVDGGNTSVPYVNTNTNNPMQGMIRISGSDMQVFDGNNWMTLSTSYATVRLENDTEELLNWARQKRQEEVNLRMRMAEHPGLEQAYEQFRIMDILTLQEEKHGQKA